MRIIADLDGHLLLWRASTILFVALAGTAPAATGQTLQWAAPVDGNWSDISRWSPANVPNTSTEFAVMGHETAYVVTLDSSSVVGGLTISNSAATLIIPVSSSSTARSLSIGSGGLINQGLIRLTEGDGSGYANLTMGTASISGSGEIRLEDRLGTILSLPTFPGLATQQAGHRITGVGSINGRLANNGTVDANGPGVLSLAFVINNSLMRSGPGSHLQIDTLQQAPGASVLADGGTFGARSISGGLVGAVNGGTVQLPPAGSNIAALNGVTIWGPWEFGGASTFQALELGGDGIENNGSLRLIVGGTGSKAELLFTATTTITGNGYIRLTDRTKSVIEGSTDATLTNGSEHTLCGTGSINLDASFSGRFVNDGVVDADMPGQYLYLYRTTNNGLARASNGGILRVSVVQGPQGTVLADGGVVLIDSVTGGTVEAVDGSLIRVTSVLGSHLDGVYARGEWHVEDPLSIDGGGMVNDGNLQVFDTQLILATAVPLAGGGSIQLMSPATVLTVASNTAAVNEVGHTIRGTGSITFPSNAAILNRGTIVADVPGQKLQTWSVTNVATMKASRGILELRGILNNQGGEIVADGGTVQFFGASRVVGGVIESRNGGVISVPAGTSGFVDGVIARGEWRVGGSTTSVITDLKILAGGLVNEGLIRLAEGAGSGNQRCYFSQSAVIDGPGELRLEDAADSEVFVPAGVTGTNGHSHTISGVGLITGTGTGLLVNNGILAPGVPLGTLTTKGVAQGAAGIIEIELGGPDASHRDQIVNTGTLLLNGTLRLRFRDGYQLPPCGEYAAISGGTITGQFTDFDAPRMPAGHLSLRYEPAGVVIVYLPADFDGSGFVDTDDFDAFVHAFEAGTDDADFDNTGFVDTDDFDAFVHAFESGC